jgi:hypothetical protein
LNSSSNSGGKPSSDLFSSLVYYADVLLPYPIIADDASATFDKGKVLFVYMHIFVSKKDKGKLFVCVSIYI